MRRQLLWLKDSWVWLLETRVLGSMPSGGARLRALDVGCGPGYVMELLAPYFDVVGVDKDAGMIERSKQRGLEVTEADVCDLPYDDNSFDLVYCSYLVMWLDDPSRAIGEMKRVAKDWVVCLAEPDYGGRIDHPAELTDLTKYLASEIRELGGDPYVGRKLRSLFNKNDMEAEVGVHQGVWDLDTVRHQSKEEWANIERAALQKVDSASLRKGQEIWEGALGSGDLFQFNPVFYALGRKI